MDSHTHKVRLRGIRAGIARLKADCLIATKPANVTYLTGFTGDDGWAVVLPGAVMLVTDSRYTEQAAAQCRTCRIVERKEAMAKAIAELLRNRRGIKTAAVEKSTSLADFQSLRKHLHCRLKGAEGIVESARRKKDTSEVSAIRAAAKIAARAFERVLRQVKPGLTENELAGIVDFEIRKAGGNNSFETIVAFGPNASKPHHQPTSRKLRKNDTVLIDFGTRHNGYCCDLTRCFPVGTKNLALFEIINFDYHTIDLILKFFSPVVPAIANLDDLIDIFCFFDMRVYGQAKFFEDLQRFIMVFCQQL
jgi:Xaa-Pro aminopeptidase